MKPNRQEPEVDAGMIGSSCQVELRIWAYGGKSKGSKYDIQI